MPRWLFYGLAGTALVLALATLGAALVYAGVANPSARRDRDREAAMYAIARTLHDRYAREPHAVLPATIPDEHVAYRNLGSGRYQLCTSFENGRPGGTGTWSHAKGRNCFQFSVYDPPWVDPSQRRWIFPTC
jgi:hypothetical protein